MIEILKAAAQISTMWSLAAFAIGVVVFLVQRKARANTGLLWGSLATIALIGITPIAGSIYLQTNKDQLKSASLYRLRVTVLDPQQSPVDQAKVWSSIGGEPKGVAGGWEFDIPTQNKPADGRLIIYAAFPAAFLTGSQAVELSASNTSPAVTVQLHHDVSSHLRGVVTNGEGQALSAAMVSIVGYQAIQTDSSGGFILPAHAATGQQVHVHVEKDGYQAVTEWLPAGDASVQLSLQRK